MKVNAVSTWIFLALILITGSPCYALAQIEKEPLIITDNPLTVGFTINMRLQAFTQGRDWNKKFQDDLSKHTTLFGFNCNFHLQKLPTFEFSFQEIRLDNLEIYKPYLDKLDKGYLNGLQMGLGSVGSILDFMFYFGRYQYVLSAKRYEGKETRKTLIHSEVLWNSPNYMTIKRTYQIEEWEAWADKIVMTRKTHFFGGGVRFIKLEDPYIDGFVMGGGAGKWVCPALFYRYEYLKPLAWIDPRTAFVRQTGTILFRLTSSLFYQKNRVAFESKLYCGGRFGAKFSLDYGLEIGYGNSIDRRGIWTFSPYLGIALL